MRTIKALVLGLLCPNVIWAGCAPEKMIRVVFRDATPGLDSNSFTAKPKTLYRLGTRYGRLEELLDSENHIQQLMIANEPDLWMINLVTKTGQHIVDSGEPYYFHAPVFGAPDAPEFLKTFEFGCELAYMKEKSVSPEAAPIETRKLESYRVSQGNLTIFLAVDSKLQKPVLAALHNGDKVVSVVKYLYYDSGLEPDLTLFKAPSGVALSEKTP